MDDTYYLYNMYNTVLCIRIPWAAGGLLWHRMICPVVWLFWGVFAGKCLTTFLFCLDIAALKIQANVAPDIGDKCVQGKA